MTEGAAVELYAGDTCGHRRTVNIGATAGSTAVQVHHCVDCDAEFWFTQ